ncbi:MAG TPA: hypothetical protein VF115_15235 [Acidimicrobiia bacterium]
MRIARLILVAVVAALALAACSDTPDSVEDAVSSLPESEDVADMAADVQTELNELATEIENSDVADDLQTAWSEVRTEITSAISSVTSGETLDTESIQTELDEFQTELEAMGDDVGDNVMSAWTELRSSFEQLMS